MVWMVILFLEQDNQLLITFHQPLEVCFCLRNDLIEHILIPLHTYFEVFDFMAIITVLHSVHQVIQSQFTIFNFPYYWFAILVEERL